LGAEADLTSNEYRAFIYLNIIHRLKGGGVEQEFVLKEYKEKTILKRIALLVKLFRENLTENVILDENGLFVKLFQSVIVGSANSDKLTDKLKQILHDYFDIPVLDSSKSGRVLFSHSTFKEYLMAFGNHHHTDITSNIS
jgi:hypothetical protein